jgi:hypothetical protein
MVAVEIQEWMDGIENPHLRVYVENFLPLGEKRIEDMNLVKLKRFGEHDV